MARQGKRLRWTLAAAALIALAGCAHAPEAARADHGTTPVRASAPPLPAPDAIDALALDAMHATGARGLAVAVIDDGRVVHVAAHGERNARGEPLGTDTVMYGASLTKAVFGWTVLQLVDDGVVALDTPVADLLARPLPDYGDAKGYADWSGLADDARWRALTPRILLAHGSGFANFGFLEPDQRLRIHFEPGTRYAYSGDGLTLLQFALERGRPALDVGAEMRRRVFDRFGMTRTSTTWRDDFAADNADGWTLDGTPEPHDARSRTRAAGSMDTTIADFARFAAAYVRGDGLTPASTEALLTPTIAIDTASQFPTFQPPLPPDARRADLAAGLGVVLFDGPQGAGFFKGGHNDTTANTWVCVRASRRCVVLLSNDVRAEAAFPALVRGVLGETGAPWSWEYGDLAFWPGPAAPAR